MRLLSVSSLALTAIPLVAAASQHGSSNNHRHRSLAVRQRGEVSKLQKRSYSGQATWYDVGLGACGQWNNPGDFIVALDTPLYGGGYPGPHCFQSITITSGGKSAQAVIMDECPTCNYGDLDMSKGLFQHFADLGQGVFPITWWYNDGSGGGGGGGNGNGEKKTTKSPTPKPTPKPTSTHHTHTHTSTSTTSTSTSSSDTSSSASKTSSADASGSTDTPGSVGTDPSPDNLSSFNAIMINLGALVVGAGSS